jgi:RNA polymerase sigma-70 factor, ECF subfamily
MGVQSLWMDKEKQYLELLKENSNRIYRICCRYMNDGDICKDAYQEVLINVWNNLERFRGDAKISTWIYRITVNTCLTFIKTTKKRNEKVEVVSSMEHLAIPDPGTPDQQIEDEEKLSFFNLFIQQLCLPDRTLVSLYLEELSTREIAEVTGLSEANVRVRIHRIKEQIKKEWKEKYHGT